MINKDYSTKKFQKKLLSLQAQYTTPAITLQSNLHITLLQTENLISLHKTAQVYLTWELLHLVLKRMNGKWC